MNNLTSLPPTIGRLGRLRHLDLSDNRLASLPPDLGGLSSLESLRLRSNSLVSVCAEVGALSRLSCLDLSMNHLTALPEGVMRLASLHQVGGGRGRRPSSAAPAEACSTRTWRGPGVDFACLPRDQPLALISE